MNAPQFRRHLCVACLSCLAAAGCASPYRSDQGALFGGVTGAGVGALVGEAVHHPLAGAAIGAGVGALTGAAVGNNLDQIEARNRAEIAARLGRPVSAGAVTRDDVIAMTRAGVPEENIVTQIRYHGMAAPVQAGDLIVLQQQGVSPRIVQAMQAPPPAPAQPMVVQPAPGPVVYGAYPPPYYYGPPYPYYRGWYGRPY